MTTIFCVVKKFSEKWTTLGLYLYQPVDASSLAVNRILLGSLLLLDALQERGLSRAELLWADDSQLEHFQCRFPLLEGWLTRFERPEAMCAVYTLLLGGIIGVILGYHYRLSALTYATAYWYLLLVEKSRWNNHSYLFGLLALICLVSDSHQKWSIDAVQRRSKVNLPSKPSAPFWQIGLLRFQLFLVYFYAGLKKVDSDWLQGHSMVALSDHWIWAPFTGWLGLPAHFIDYYVIHLGGFIFDSVIGFLLLHRQTRPLAFALATFFNVANSQMFTIGMFPWVMLAVMPIFCSPDWPLRVVEKVMGSGGSEKEEKVDENDNEKKEIKKIATLKPAPINNNQTRVQRSKNLVKFFGAEFRWFLLSSYFATLRPSKLKQTSALALAKDQNKPSDLPKTSSQERLTVRQHLTLLLLFFYITLQLFMPFVHRFLLPGYSTWTDGPYGTSWDMMVHNWQHIHTRVTVHAVNQATQNRVTLYLDPDNWTLNGRWAHHADMAVQFGKCVADRLKRHFGLKATALYLDVWSSLNGRFSQRMYRPGVDLLSFRWSPFEAPTKLVMPILDLSEMWRGRMEEVDRSIAEYLQSVNRTSQVSSSSSFLLYVADAPDLPQETYIDEALFNGDATLFVLSGRVQVQLDRSGRQLLVSNNGNDLVMTVDKTVKLPLGSVAIITVRGCEPAYYGLLYPPLLKNRDDLKNESSTSSLPKEEVVRPLNTLYSSLRVLFIGGRFLLTEAGRLILRIGELVVSLVDEYLIKWFENINFGCQCSLNWWLW